MARKTIIPLLFGIVGTAILISLGVWQVQRLHWKNSVLAEIEARIGADPVAMPEFPDPVADKYLPVEIHGVIGRVGVGAPELHVLVSRKQIGAGYRVIAPIQTGGRIVMLDRGFVAADQKSAPRPSQEIAIIGNLHWPDDRSPATPTNDPGANIWFARDIDEMVALLQPSVHQLHLVIEECRPFLPESTHSTMLASSAIMMGLSCQVADSTLSERRSALKRLQTAYFELKDELDVAMVAAQASSSSQADESR